jgi:hypothetical protein
MVHILQGSAQAMDARSLVEPEPENMGSAWTTYAPISGNSVKERTWRGRTALK